MPITLILLSLLVFASLLAILFYIKFIDERNKNLNLQGKLNPYQKKTHFLTNPELELFKLLTTSINERKFHICPQLHLSTLLKVKDDANDIKGKFEWLNSLYVDFVIFEKENMNPILVIELNDSTHKWGSRHARDQFVAKALMENDIKLVTIAGINADEISIQNILNEYNLVN